MGASRACPRQAMIDGARAWDVPSRVAARDSCRHRKLNFVTSNATDTHPHLDRRHQTSTMATTDAKIAYVVLRSYSLRPTNTAIANSSPNPAPNSPSTNFPSSKPTSSPPVHSRSFRPQCEIILRFSSPAATTENSSRDAKLSTDIATWYLRTSRKCGVRRRDSVTARRDGRSTRIVSSARCS